MEIDFEDPEMEKALRHLSPNERKRFIENSTKKLREKRILEAKKAYSNMTKNFTSKYSAQKEEHDKKHKGKKSEEELAELKEQIDNLNKRIEIQQQNIGKAFVDATENSNLEQERRNRAKELEKKRKQEERERFNDALVFTRDNDPNKPQQMRNERIVAAKDHANAVQDKIVQKQSRLKAKQEEEERKRQLQFEQEEKDKMTPKLTIEDYSRTYTHAGIGIIPVNKGADIYQKQLEEQEKKDKELEKERFVSKRKRTKAALNDTKFEQQVTQLERELELIEQSEVNQSLKEIADGTSKVREQYNFDQKRSRHQAYMKKVWLAVDDEPKPRGPAPQPEPFRIPSSSTLSSSMSSGF